MQKKGGKNRMERLEISSRKLGIPRNISWKYFTGTIKDNNGIHLTEAEDVKKRWQEYIEELYKKDLHNLDTPNSVITHLESDILQCEVKRALGSIITNKASDGILVELFQVLKDDVKVLHSNASKFGKLSTVTTGLEKVRVHSNPKERQSQRMLKLLHNCTHLTH